MRYLNKISLLSISTAFAFLACESEKSPFDVSPNDSFDPKRSEQPYPQIAIPEGVDLESPTWKGIDLSPKPPVIPVSANEEKKSFVLKPGYSIDPVLSEPQIKEPAAIQFDGNGRMYVLELRTYMQDIDANGELMPTSRISRWEDKDNDGVYETGVVFLDSLVFPRFIVPFGPNTILSMESNEDHVYKFTDTDGDGKADKKELFASGLGRSGNVEHQTSFLTWAMDNWMYSTYNSKRIRWTADGVIQEPSGNPWGQWGVTQDNYGKLWFQDGAGGVPQGFQFPIAYGNFSVKGQWREGFRTPYSLVKLADFQPGMKEVNPDGSLNNVTGAAGSDVYRGDRLPKELVGQYFYGEPVGRIVRQVNTENEEGLTYIQNAYIESQSEFIQSTDPLFRPVDMATAPDGTMYIVDMYRGIIQEGNWTQDGSYLRTKIQQYQMDDVIGNGRIWRLTYEGMPRNTEKPRMYEETSAELIRHLENPNGWWRDQAQQLMILNQDKSIVPDLEKMAKTSSNELARIHAIWTLEGLNSLDLELVRALFKDANPKIRIAALRASETLYKYGEKSLAEDYKQMALDKDPNVAIQSLFSAFILKIDGVEELMASTMKSNPSKGVELVGTQILEKIAEAKEAASTKFEPAELALFTKGKTIFDSYCSTCHGPKGLGSPAGDGQLIAPAFSGSQRIQGHPEYAVKTLLHGLTGNLEGKEYEGVMIAMDMNDDDYIASVLSYIRNDFGNSASFVSPEYVAQIREETKDREGNYSFEELTSEVPKSLAPQDNWVVTASSTALQGVGSTKDPSYAFGFKGWKTETEQESGMWFQVELPDAHQLAEIQFNSGKDDFPISYTVSTSPNGNNWTEVGSGKGESGVNNLRWKSDDRVRFIRIQAKEKGGKPWAMKNLVLFAR
ncbi:mono/diheme cytochrome c family protein/glucose/arabinose dehydrogenase [Algoriphagus iocasae]|uniref:Mono/diheme cytochrome c family protein/glucose/arabinose dehydrogenase n=1 Tax=Algoriphagus iocasae TaxID=1836499 RepID=A0A841MUY6_9BACT|nr:discoidin domain-containing protein [Algoriphagus iocasae]MBB6328414.1 mono/diheme cytochrome c family protein/glucose/arabinose dehydrogenase [Algoriphagus iocasae]